MCETCLYMLKRRQLRIPFEAAAAEGINIGVTHSMVSGLSKSAEFHEIR